MGEKKKKEAETARWKKIVVVGACVLFVFLMVVSGMGTGWLSMFKTVKPGQAVQIEYTIFNSNGDPVITSNQQLYTQLYSEGKSVIPSKSLTILANHSLEKSVFPVNVYTQSAGWDTELAIFASEYDAISNAVVGMKVNEKKNVTLPASSSMTQLWTEAQLSKSGIAMNNVSVGDVFAMGVADTPVDVASNESAQSYLRPAEVVRKTTAGVIVDFGYPLAEVRVLAIGAEN